MESSSLTRVQAQAPCIGSAVLFTGPPGKLFLQYFSSSPVQGSKTPPTFYFSGVEFDFSPIVIILNKIILAICNKGWYNFLLYFHELNGGGEDSSCEFSGCHSSWPDTDHNQSGRSNNAQSFLMLKFMVYYE